MGKNYFKRVAFYVISTKQKADEDTFKIGIHTGTADSLIKRYLTYFPDIIIYYFQYLDEMTGKIERTIKKELYDIRIENINGNRSEWIMMPLKILHIYITSLIDCDNDIIIDKIAKIDLLNNNKSDSLTNTTKNNITKIKINTTNTDYSYAEQLADIDETKYNISELLIKQKYVKMNEIEKLVLEKYFFMKRFRIKNSSNKELFINFHKTYANKESIMKRFERFFSYKDNLDNFDYIDDLDDHDDAKNKVKDKIILDMINILIGKSKKSYASDFHYIFSHDEYEKAIANVAYDSMYFKDEEKFRPLFKKCPGKFKPISEFNAKSYMNVIKSVLSHYGIDFCICGRKRVNGKLAYEYSMYFKDEEKFRPLFKKCPGKFKPISEFNAKSYMNVIKSVLSHYGIDFCICGRKRVNGKLAYEYSLSATEQIKDIVDFKHKLIDDLSEYDDLF
ncbi:hypothetical protein QLL95_gp0359 [Cotonvirus japonicus]|uniref:Helicase n=1 Tax=Cotonvirus japonicus TaxID=2811091 RepID=A0ABM7NQR6_9VIRU|nr:helicase [Cotonvirus japonicus]YP_010842372.1 hypothetical protein QLL95_gp0359 [Cotonvirus japonicus]BCS82490.1 helicase [Cotonvirus japonicus]BCS83764.1 hypothetical protein [Cotonvirus japonicus]